MAIKYRVYEFQGKKNNPKNGNWYARIVNNGTLTTRQLAQRIQKNVSAKESDVFAVLTELSNCINEALQDGYKCKLDYLGTLYPTLVTKPAETALKFTASNIKRVNVRFMAEKFYDRNSNTFSKPLLNGVRVQEDTTYETPWKNASEEEEEEEVQP